MKTPTEKRLRIICHPTYTQVGALIVALGPLGIPFEAVADDAAPTQGRSSGKRRKTPRPPVRRAQNGVGLNTLILRAVARGASRDGLRKMAVRHGYNESSVAPALTTLFAGKMLKGKGSETLELTEKAKAAA